MPLSDYEQRVLHQIEEQLQAEDPKFASVIAGSRGRMLAFGRRLGAAVSFAVGVGLMVGGLALPSLMVGGLSIVSVLGFLLMFGAAVYGVPPAINPYGRVRSLINAASSHHSMRRSNGTDSR